VAVVGKSRRGLPQRFRDYIPFPQEKDVRPGTDKSRESLSLINEILTVERCGKVNFGEQKGYRRVRTQGTGHVGDCRVGCQPHEESPRSGSHMTPGLRVAFTHMRTAPAGAL